MSSRRLLISLLHLNSVRSFLHNLQRDMVNVEAFVEQLLEVTQYCTRSVPTGALLWALGASTSEVKVEM